MGSSLPRRRSSRWRCWTRWPPSTKRASRRKRARSERSAVVHDRHHLEGWALLDDVGGDELIDIGGVQASFGEHFATMLAEAGRLEDRLFFGATEACVARGCEVGGAILQVVCGEQPELLQVSVGG